MQNQLHLPFPFSSFNLTSVLDHSSVLHSKKSNLLSPSQSSVVMADPKSEHLDPQLEANCDDSVSHLLFPSALFGSSVGGLTASTIYSRSAKMNNNSGGGGGTIYNNPRNPWGNGQNDSGFLKRGSVGAGNSFTIDSLLGINEVIQSNSINNNNINAGVPTMKEQHHHYQYHHLFQPHPPPPPPGQYSSNFGPVAHNCNNNNSKHGFNSKLNLAHTHAPPHALARSEHHDPYYGNLKRRKGNNATVITYHASASVPATVMERPADFSSKSKPQQHGSTKCSSTQGNKSISDGNKLNKAMATENSEKAQASSQNSVNSVRRVAKSKRVRTIFTPEQLEKLEAEFERQQYMVGPERLFLASSLHLTEAQVKVWFQNRRIKWRKQHLELQQQRLAIIRSQQLDMDDDDGSSVSDFGVMTSAAASASPASTILSSSNNENSNIIMESNAGINYMAANYHHGGLQSDIHNMTIKNQPI